jgi:hypothetical protein
MFHASYDNLDAIGDEAVTDRRGVSEAGFVGATSATLSRSIIVPV